MTDMTFLEIVPIILAVYLFKRELSNKQILFHTDNNSFVAILNKKSSKSRRVMQLICSLVLQTFTFNMQCKIQSLGSNGTD